MFYHSNIGDIVTEIKMTVGQGDGRGNGGKRHSGQDIIRIPPPVDVSSAPSHALAGNTNPKLSDEFPHISLKYYPPYLNMICQL